MVNELSLNRLYSGGIITNYYCSSKCGHCLYRSSPKWPHEFITLETTEKSCKKISELGCRSVHIGGGEPFFRPNDLIDTLRTIRACDLHVDYVETNASWFVDQDSACTLLNKLLDTGLTALLVSISPLHNEYIPYAKVKGLLQACSSTGMGVFPWVTEFIDDIASLDESTIHSRADYEKQFGENYWDTLPQRCYITNGGRALQTFSKSGKRTAVPSLISSCKGGCPELSETTHFHIDLHGNYIPGLCAGLSIDSDDLGKRLVKEEYPLITVLHNKGVGGLLRLAMDDYGFEASRSQYSSKCELCYEIRKFLVLTCNIKSKELQPMGHYLYD